ncbi:unnamed protein product [Allacma fusca]|uniref:Glycosyl transferase CAP10 domain-containing protein n=1 Tax=Allacma fusca TaxID=39272 RepID=A0A8J2J1C7_9HEXA|nr:unnamed protein product [Allacma fusca]
MFITITLRACYCFLLIGSLAFRQGVLGEDGSSSSVLKKTPELTIVAHSRDESVKSKGRDLDRVDVTKSIVNGPGLEPHAVVLPARYFYIQLVDRKGRNFNTTENDDHLKVRIDCNGERQVWSQLLSRRRGSYIVRYKMFHSCLNGLRIIITYRNKHVAKSPYIIKFPVHPAVCNCPKLESINWLVRANCTRNHQQIDSDLGPFTSVNFSSVLEQAIERFYQPGSHSFCHYVIKDNKVYRKCYGQHVGFHIFPDSLLLTLIRTMYLRDMEFIINLGDWPLVNKDKVKPLIPIFSWCKTNATADILLPTYELVEASLEGMGRVSLDMMTVQSNSEVPWDDKIDKVFWRGRDSRQERLDLILLSRKYPDLFNVSLTNFFFFRDQMDLYGPKAQHISFFKFFNYKYQLNIDGTVAAYRFPFLLAGDSVVFKTESPYFEHFYKDLKPWTHFIPVKADLEDLIEKIQWLKENDHKAKAVGENGRKYAQENLMPLEVMCYHVEVFNKWADRLANPVTVLPGMELVEPPDLPKGTKCDCSPGPRHLSSDSWDKNEL